MNIEELKGKSLYISGKITGDPDYKQKFANAERILIYCGFNPVNPTVINETEWIKAMIEALVMMLGCDVVVLLPDWGESKGVQIEKDLAEKLGMPIVKFTDLVLYGKID